MAKSKRNRRNQNQIASASQGALVKLDPSPQPAIVIRHTDALKVAGVRRLSAELEEVIEIIARERVYRAMLARSGRYLLAAPEGPE
jgi:hypothetical protein